MNYGLYLLPDGFSDEFLQDAVDHGITHFRTEVDSGPQWRDAASWLDRVHRVGGKVVVAFKFSVDRPETLDERVRVCSSIRNHPALAGYDSWDEFNMARPDERERIISNMAETYRTIRAVDPDHVAHPVRLSLALDGNFPSSASGVDLGTLADMVGINVYVLTDAKQVLLPEDFRRPCRETKILSANKPLYVTAQGTEYGRWPVEEGQPPLSWYQPSIQQMVEMSLQSSLEGASELWWFNWLLPAQEHGNIFEATRRLTGRAERITHAFTASVEAAGGGWKPVAMLKPNTSYVARPRPDTAYRMDARPNGPFVNHRGIGAPVIDPNDWIVPPYKPRVKVGCLVLLVRLPGGENWIQDFADTDELRFSTKQLPASVEMFIMDVQGKKQDNSGECVVDFFEIA